ncbi:hypothetical protein ASG01_07390 [Chryseobacterium sp. Leaf180]|nr:hypothetical protein ASG01_07390 [Chryseobacterium sp. Leaf180]
MLLKNLKADLKYIINSALDHTLNICNDFTTINSNINNVKNPAAMIFQGVISAVIVPSLTKHFGKVPVAGRFLMKGSDKALTFAVSQLKLQEDKLMVSEYIGRGHTVIAVRIESIQNFIRTFNVKTDQFLNSCFSPIQTPIKISFYITATFTFVFILGCYFLQNRFF